MAVLDSNKKADVYETLSSINMAFAGIDDHLRSIRQAGIISRKDVYLFRAFAKEAQSEINTQALMGLHSIEEEDLTRNARIRERWEQYLKGEKAEFSFPGGRAQTKKERTKAKTPTARAKSASKKHSVSKKSKDVPREVKLLNP
jgi:hypothetical protein